jgi:predicted nucleic acid-binding protein
MAVFVIDASVAAAWSFKDETTDYTNAVLKAVSGLVEATAPRLWAYEIRNSVLMGLRRKRITRADADEFLNSIVDLRISLVDPLSYDGIFALADRHGLTLYDAAYLDLAMREDLPIASLDDELIRAAERARQRIFERK